MKCSDGEGWHSYVSRRQERERAIVRQRLQERETRREKEGGMRSGDGSIARGDREKERKRGRDNYPESRMGFRDESREG